MVPSDWFSNKQLKKNQSTKLLDSSIVRKEQNLSLKSPFLWRKEKKVQKYKINLNPKQSKTFRCFQ